MIAHIPVHVTDEDIIRISARNPGWQIERIAGELVISPPSGWSSDARSARAVVILAKWAETVGGIVTASQGGAKIANGDLVTPDAAWTSAPRWNALSREQKEQFLPFAPDVVIEVLSDSDSRKKLRDKCERWLDGGAGYVILIDPYLPLITAWSDPPTEDFPDFTPVLEIE